MNLHKFNIGIIGGGIGGVAAAVALHRAGIEATVYERATEFREVGAGMMLWPNATRVLKELGLLERVAASSGPNRHFIVRSSAGTVLMDIGLGRFEVPALCTRRSDLLDALLSALPPERIRLGHDFESFEYRKTSVRVNFSGSMSGGGISMRNTTSLSVPTVSAPASVLSYWESTNPSTGATPSGAGWRVLWAPFRPARTAKPGDEENASASSIPAATGSPGTPPQTPIRATSILPKGARVNSCGCSRAGTNR